MCVGLDKTYTQQTWTRASSEPKIEVRQGSFVKLGNKPYICSLLVPEGVCRVTIQSQWYWITQGKFKKYCCPKNWLKYIHTITSTRQQHKGLCSFWCIFNIWTSLATKVDKSAKYQSALFCSLVTVNFVPVVSSAWCGVFSLKCKVFNIKYVIGTLYIHCSAIPTAGGAKPYRLVPQRC